MIRPPIGALVRFAAFLVMRATMSPGVTSRFRGKMWRQGAGITLMVAADFRFLHARRRWRVSGGPHDDRRDRGPGTSGARSLA